MSVASRRSKRLAVENVEFLSTELEFCDATDLLADMSSIIAPVGGLYMGGYADRGEAIGKIAKEFVGGRLTTLLARLLACTTMSIRGEGKVDLIDSREKLNAAFTGRSKFIYPAVKLALEVSFKDFLDGLALIGVKTPTLSHSEDSSPSMTATG